MSKDVVQPLIAASPHVLSTPLSVWVFVSLVRVEYYVPLTKALGSHWALVSAAEK
jgi:hypothetical protein